MEHRALRFDPPQITLHESPVGTLYLKYVEDVSKSNQGGIKHCRRKAVMHYANAENPQQCHIRMLQEYTSLCPPEGKQNAFYLQPRRKYEESAKICFTKQPMSQNSIQPVVPDLFRSAGIVGNFENHSRRVTAATSLYEHDVDEQLIMKRIEHRSVEGNQT
ncbi:uncharacterized protein LOC144357565 [Saccoglossus kowalevskii]